MTRTLLARSVRYSRATIGALAAACTLGCLLALPAGALAVGPPFNPASPTVFVIHGTPQAQLSKAVESNGQLVFQDIGAPQPQYNSIAYDTVDNYIYGIDFTGGPTQGDILQVGADGVPSDTGVKIPNAYVDAAWNPTNNEIYFETNSAGNEALQPYNPATNTLGTPIPLSANVAFDLTYADGFFWGWGGGVIDRVDPATGTVTKFPGTSSLFTGCFNAPNCSGAGADWTYGNGNLGFNENQGQIYQIAISNPASASPTFTLVSRQPGPASGNIDGAANPGLPTDLVMHKSVAPATPPDGGQITYTLTVTNNGPGNSSGYTISDTLPADLVNPTTNATGCSITAGVLTCVSANPLDAGTTSAPITVTADVPSPFTAPITNTASVTANEQDPNLTNNMASVTTTPKADVQIVKSGQPNPAVPGTDETYSLQVTNNGPDTAEDVVVTDPVPSGETFASADAGCSEANDVVSCSLASLASGASHTFTFTAHVASSVTTCPANTANVISDTNDPDTGNNISTVCVPPTPKADLAITKLPSTTAPQAGGQVIYTLVVTNNGPSDATGVTVTDAVPSELTVSSLQPSQGTCDTSTSVCTLGSITNGASAQILVTATIAASASGSITNTASVIGQQDDPDKSNNVATSTITPTPAPLPRSDLSVNKTVNHKTVTVGQKLSYTVTVTNNGPDIAPAVALTDTWSLSLKVLSAKPSQGTCKVGKPTTCSLGAIASGKHATIKVVARVANIGTEANTASATCACIDPNTHNNMHHAKAKVIGRLILKKTVKPGAITTGQMATFYLSVSNPNSVAVKHVRVCDTMPRGLLYVASRPTAARSHGAYCWALGSIGSHRSKTVWIRGEAKLSTHGRVVNHATASAPGVETAHAQATLDVHNTANVCGSIVTARPADARGSGRRHTVAQIAC